MQYFSKEHPLKVYMVDDEEKECLNIQNYLSKFDYIHFLGYACNPLNAFDIIKDRLPHVIIVDLVMKGLQGLQVIEKVREMALEINPFILISSGYSSNLDTIKSMRSGSDYNIAKSGKQTPESILFHLKSLEEKITDTNKNTYNPVTLDELKKNIAMSDTSRVEQKMSSLLNELRMPAGNDGYGYIKYALQLCMTGDFHNMDMSNVIYPAIASKFKQNPKNVEIAIRRAITKTWDNKKNLENLERLYTGYINPERGNPSNKEFIFHYAELLAPHYGISMNG